MDEKTKTFEEVAGQTVTVQRPPDGYVVIADSNGNNRVVSKELLLQHAGGIGVLILDGLSPTSPPPSTSSASNPQ